MEREYVENVLDDSRSPSGLYIIELKHDDGLVDKSIVRPTLALHLGAFILTDSKRIMNNFIREINVFYIINIHCTDTDSLYIEEKIWYGFDKASLVGSDLFQSKNDYKSGGIFYRLHIEAKIKYSLIISKDVNIDKHKTFKGVNASKRFLDRSQCFKMIEGKKLSGLLPKSWEKGLIVELSYRRK